MLKILFIKLRNLLLIATSLTLVGCQGLHQGVLNPKGLITFQERQLLFDAVALMLIVVLPVVIMSFAFIRRYRASHQRGQYRPNWCHNTLLESIWWGVPCVLIVILGVMTWHYSHQLDPYRKIDIPGKVMKIQVVALPWKWMFIYPEQNIATVNYLEIPKDRQVEFLLTSDNVPMSAFFVPQVASQIYTMAGMRTRLHAVANRLGTFEGLSSQYNGDGFSDMHFKVKVVEPNVMRQWIAQVKKSDKQLNQMTYRKLRQNSIAEPVHYYSSVKPNLFTSVLKSYNHAVHPSKMQAGSQSSA